MDELIFSRFRSSVTEINKKLSGNNITESGVHVVSALWALTLCIPKKERFDIVGLFKKIEKKYLSTESNMKIFNAEIDIYRKIIDGTMKPRGDWFLGEQTPDSPIWFLVAPFGDFIWNHEMIWNYEKAQVVIRGIDVAFDFSITMIATCELFSQYVASIDDILDNQSSVEKQQFVLPKDQIEQFIGPEKARKRKLYEEDIKEGTNENHEICVANTYNRNEHSNHIGIKWLNFYTYVRCPFAILALLIGGLNFFAQLSKSPKVDSGIIIFASLFLVANIVFHVFLIFWLVNRSPKGYYGVLIYTVIEAVFGGWIVAIPNFIYFKKRRHLFFDDAKPSQSTDRQSYVNDPCKQTVYGYCRHCGQPLLSNSNYCRKCGTKILNGGNQ